MVEKKLKHKLTNSQKLFNDKINTAKLSQDDDHVGDDSFFDMNKQVDVLLEQYHNFGKIIVAYDFDDTVYPYRGKSCHQVQQLLRDLRPYATLILLTARAHERREGIEEFLKNNDIPFDFINKDPRGNEITTGKLLYNQLLDDKAGLRESYEILKDFLCRVKEE